jgi:dephospho-CoA kinase
MYEPVGSSTVNEHADPAPSGPAAASGAPHVLHVGLTGGIGAGKSTAARLLRGHGALVLDADVAAREVVEPGTDGFDAVLAEFGPDVLGPDGTLDRAALGAVVFASPDRRAALNAIVHPRVRAWMAGRAAGAPPGSVVVQDIPLLVESGLAPAFDLVVVVDAPDEVRIERLGADRGMTRQEAAARIAAQASRAQRLAAADEVLDNAGAPEELTRQVAALWERIARAAADRDPRADIRRSTGNRSDGW